MRWNWTTVRRQGLRDLLPGAALATDGATKKIPSQIHARRWIRSAPLLAMIWAASFNPLPQNERAVDRSRPMVGSHPGSFWATWPEAPTCGVARTGWRGPFGQRLLVRRFVHSTARPPYPWIRVITMTAQVWGNWLMIGLVVTAFCCAVTLRYPGHGKGTHHR